MNVNKSMNKRKNNEQNTLITVHTFFIAVVSQLKFENTYLGIICLGVWLSCVPFKNQWQEHRERQTYNCDEWTKTVIFVFVSSDRRLLNVSASLSPESSLALIIVATSLRIRRTVSSLELSQVNICILQISWFINQANTIPSLCVYGVIAMLPGLYVPRLIWHIMGTWQRVLCCPLLHVFSPRVLYVPMALRSAALHKTFSKVYLTLCSHCAIHMHTDILCSQILFKPLANWLYIN